jgi:hypothetical protein
MSIISSDPLAFLIGQGGLVGTPLKEGGAGGAENLDVAQRGAVIGEPIPIVFCRRVSDVGGVLISPAATEARFENSLTNEVTGAYHLVLSEGQIDSIQVRDVFQRSCRVGSFSQTYDKRAGTFIPGNFIVPRDGFTTPECPSYCGTGGRYTGLSTLAFQATYPDGVDQWNRQVHCFIRGGIHVPRLLDSTLGPSNNVADLLLYLLRNSSRVPEAQIDTASLLAGATFTNVNGFWFNGVVSESTNVRDWIDSTLQYFLLRQTRVAGKEAVSPLLPVNNDGTIKTTAVSWEFTFTEEHIIPDSFEITYTALADRKPFCAMVLWRQQDDNGIGIIRTAEVRYAGTAEDGPYEQHDLSEFCASENHAVKVGAYIISKRRHVTHRLQIGVKPDAFNPTLAAGDLVRVRLDRIASTGVASRHDYLYEVDRIGKSLAGDVQLELTHFPIDGDLASVVAKEVNAAAGAGLVLPTGLTGVTCDINSSDDLTIPEDISLDLEYWKDYWADNGFPDLFDEATYNTDVAEIDPIDTSGLGGIDSSLPTGWTSTGGSENNPSDSLDSQTGSVPSGSGSGYTYSGDPENPVVGDTLTAPSICEGGIVTFYRVDPTVPGGKVSVASAASTYTMVINDVDKSVYLEVSCPDPSSPTGYGEPIQLGPTPIISSGCGGIEGITYNGTVPPPGNTIGAPITLANGAITRQSYATTPSTCDAPADPPTTSDGSSVTLQNVKGIELVSVPGTCGGTKQLLWRVTYSTGVIEDRNIVQIGDSRGFASLSADVTVTWDDPSAVTYCP